MQASGALTAEEFELRYAKPTGKIRLSRGLWSRYLRGETLPQGAATGGGRSLVDRLDKQYPDTRDVFFHPVWDLLDFENLLGPAQLREKYLCLHEDIWSQFVACQEKPNPNAPSTPLTFWPLIQSESVRKMRLARLRGLDGLTACLIEARMGYLSQTEQRFVYSLAAAGQQLRKLSTELAFSSTRMQSALLVMEALCVAFVAKKTIDAPPSNEAHSALRSIARCWQWNWMDKYEAHLKTRSTSSKKSLQNWMKLALGENRVGIAARI